MEAMEVSVHVKHVRPWWQQYHMASSAYSQDNYMQCKAIHALRTVNCELRDKIVVGNSG